MRVSRIPAECHVVRVCLPSSLDDDGRPDAGAFELRRNLDGSLKEPSLSVHWLDYLVSSDSLEFKLQVLRSYRVNSQLKQFEQRSKAWLVVLRVGVIEASSGELGLQCLADPQLDESACQCNEHGLVGRQGPIAPSAAVIDAHACIDPFPAASPEEFALMTHLRDLVEHHEQQGPWKDPL